MAHAMNIAIDSFSILILLLMLFNFGAKISRKREMDDNIFTAMLLTNIAILLADIFTWFVDGMPGEGARSINIASNSLYYPLQTIMCFLWVVYCDYKLFENPTRLKKRLTWYLAPVAASGVLIFFNYFEPFIFFVDEANVYHRGSMYAVFLLICLLAFVHTFIMTLRVIISERGRSWQQGEPRIYLLLYPLFPIASALIQSQFYGIAIIWSGSVISLLIIYFNLQNAQITTDPLTGVNNRHRFENFMRSRLNNRQSDSILFVLMIDIDKFKEINDRYGHAIGDEAIRETARLLIRGTHRSDFIARIGGDEFVIVGERASRQEVADTIASIQSEADALQKEKPRVYSISLSIGYSLLHDNFPKTVDEMLAEADQRMYSQKQYHHEKA